MLHHSVPSASATTTTAPRTAQPAIQMLSARQGKLYPMNRFGLGRLVGGWLDASVNTARESRPQSAVVRKAYGTSAAPSSSSTSGGPRVVVLGGGFGGLYAAIHLDQLMWPRGRKPQVTLVDQSERFVFKPLLYELINGTATQEEVAPPLAQLLAPYPVRLVQAQVSSVDPGTPSGPSPSPPGTGHVALSDGSYLPYDYLVVALGSQPDDRGVPGVREWAVPFNNQEDALRVKGTLDLLCDSGSGGTVVVVGGGYSGVELAAVVGERLRGRGVGVRLLTPGADILEGCPAGQRAAAHKVLQEVGVEVVTGARVQQLSPPAPDAALATACTVTYTLQAPTSTPIGADGSASPPPQQPEQLAADLVVWTAGSSPSTKGAREGFPFPANDQGAIHTEPSLRVHGTRNVFALGDVAVATTLVEGTAPPPPATAQVALQQADYAAWNIWADINGRPLLPFRYQHLGSMMALGQLNAAVALPLPLPAPLGDAVRASPLGPLLSAAGVRLGTGNGTTGSGDGSNGVGVTLEGPLAALLRRAAYLYRQPTAEQRLSVASSWIRLGLEAAAAVAGGRAR